MNVKQGDLAILIKASVAENIGLIVQVGGFTGNHPVYGPLWGVKVDKYVQTGKFYGKEPVSFFGGVEAGAVVQAPDDWLRPVSGIPETSQIDEQIKEPA